MSRVHIVAEEVAKLKRLMTDNTEIKELRAQITALSSSVKGKTLKITPEVSGREFDIVVDEVAELRAQIDSLSSLVTNVKGKTLKITPDVLGLPVKPVCGNCGNSGGSDHQQNCAIDINLCTLYNPMINRWIYT